MKLCAVSFAVLPQCDNLFDVIVGLCYVQLLPTCLLSSDNTAALTLCYHCLLKV